MQNVEVKIFSCIWKCPSLLMKGSGATNFILECRSHFYLRCDLRHCSLWQTSAPTSGNFWGPKECLAPIIGQITKSLGIKS